MKFKILIAAAILPALTSAGVECYNISRPDRRTRIAEVEDRDKESDLEHAARAGVVCDTSSTPQGVFIIQEGDVMICDYAIVICPRRNGEQCDHRNCMEECARAKLDRNAHATFGDCLKIYREHSGSCPERIRSVCHSVVNMLKIVGLDESSPVDSLTYRHAKEIAAALDARELSKAYIAGCFASLRSITAERLRDYYDELGFTRPIFDLPKIRVPKKKVNVMTVEQDCLVEDWMRRLSISEDPLEQRVFVALWFERLFGVRPGDINRLTWDCIKFDGSVAKLVYKPHKTEKYEGRDDPIIIPAKLWAWVKPFYKPGELVLPRMRSARRAVSRNRAVWDVINKQYRKWGICDNPKSGKASYINRRQRITEAFNKDGVRGATAIGKNTPKVQMEHYVAIGEYAA